MGHLADRREVSSQQLIQELAIHQVGIGRAAFPAPASHPAQAGFACTERSFFQSTVKQTIPEKEKQTRLLRTPTQSTSSPGRATSAAKRAGGGTDRAGELAGGRQLQPAGLGSVLPLQPECEKCADARKFRVLLHSPIPITIAWPR